MSGGRKIEFLKDVALLSVTAFGGPQAHIAMMLDYLVSKKKYLTEAELIELNALCSLLPGPTSTQTITSIGHKLGGPLLAFITLIIWASPAVIIMSAFSFTYVYLKNEQISTEFLKFIGPMAVGFIAIAAYKISKKVVFDKLTLALLIFSATVATLYREPWVFPAVMVVGGIVSNLMKKKEEGSQQKVSIQPKWGYFVLFAGLFLLAEGLAFGLGHRPFVLFENFYRFGSLVFGGGQVLIPFMETQLVHESEFLTFEEFTTGFGLIQGLPGPVFSFSAFASGVAMKDGGYLWQLLGCVIGVTGIFLPGTILIFFIYPLWEDLKSINYIKKALAGVNATAAGLVVAATIILFMGMGMTLINIIIVGVTVAILLSNKVPGPFVVLAALVAGFIF